jgi:hypothetical protein
MDDKPVDPAESDEELARKIETHLALDEGSPGFLLNHADFQRIVRALRPDRERMVLAGLNGVKVRYAQDLAFANAGFTLGVVRAIVNGILAQ